MGSYPIPCGLLLAPHPPFTRYNLCKTVSARELHSFLESRQDFSTWIKNRIERYEFVENKDYISFHRKMERVVGGTVRIEYFVSVGMAKRTLYGRA